MPPAEFMITRVPRPSRWLLLLSVCVWLSHPHAAPADKPATAPTVLLIGDAVARQYSGMVRDLLRENVTVDYLSLPSGSTSALDEFKAEFRSWNYAIRGKTIDARELRIAVAFEDGYCLLVIVTAIGLKARS